MTRLENRLRQFTEYGLTEEERQVVLSGKEPPISFVEIAKEILDGCFLIESKGASVKIIPTIVEMYYHEENDSIKDHIVYHRNNEKFTSRPCFNLGMLHSHNSGIDIAFEFNGSQGVCRASALIRAFRIVDGSCNESLEIKTPDNRSTYFIKALLGQFSIFDGYQIRWSDTERHSSTADVSFSKRIGMDKRNSSSEEVFEAQRLWNFRLMMNDRNTNIVFVSEWLADPEQGHPVFFRELTKAFKENGVSYDTLSKEDTNDYWVRDFMPIQLSDGEFLKYKYEPDYLIGKYKDTISKCYKACATLQLKCRETSMKMEGGNVVICGNKIVMTDKVFTDNGKEKNDKEFILELEKAFGGRKVIIIPWSNPGTTDVDSKIT